MDDEFVAAVEHEHYRLEQPSLRIEPHAQLPREDSSSRSSIHTGQAACLAWSVAIRGEVQVRRRCDRGTRMPVLHRTHLPGCAVWSLAATARQDEDSPMNELLIGYARVSTHDRTSPHSA